jgi:hypothetical protein
MIYLEKDVDSGVDDNNDDEGKEELDYHGEDGVAETKNKHFLLFF